jgi:hypothetical protein
MRPILLVDGNNLGHVLGYIDKAARLYDSAALLACLDGAAQHLAARGQEVEIVLFLDDAQAAERLGSWLVRVAPVPGGDADAAIRAYAQAHASSPQILVSADRALCEDAGLWGVVPLAPGDFVARYLLPARQAGLVDWRPVEASAKTPAAAPGLRLPGDQGAAERRRQAAALKRAEAILRGQPLPPPDAYQLDLGRWSDEAELALYLAEHHLCPAHPDLTTPAEMVAAIRQHCSLQARYFSSGRVIDRLLRIFICRSERTLSLDDLARLSQTRRRKVKAALEKQGGRLGIVVAW